MYGVNTFIISSFVGKILSEKEIGERNMRKYEVVEGLKTFLDPDNGFDIWIRLSDVKSGEATDQVNEEQRE